MCGIAGGFFVNTVFLDRQEGAIKNAMASLSLRGPDFQNYIVHQQFFLAHARLSIIDTSALGNQPMTDESGRYTIVFNGEIYNYKLLKKELEQKGYPFTSGSDTEVLLKLYIEYGAACLEKLNGFFGFSVLDKESNKLFIARDRIGIKPMYYYEDEQQFLFASEMKAIMQFSIDKELNYEAAYAYFQLNYIPGEQTIFKKVKKLLPGHYIIYENGKAIINKYYEINKQQNTPEQISYENAKTRLNELMHQSIQRRLIADVPLGCFLSGGIDSSVISLLASKYSPNINTFSIGFKDEPYFDETKYAELVAKKIKTNHTVFSLSNNDLLEVLYNVLDYLDEPFADSSALAVYILCKQTKSKVTVALSGDGADEMLGGYNKHAAEYKARNNNFINSLFKIGKPFFGVLPQSRNSRTGNLFRQLNRYSEGVSLSNEERYWRWCGYSTEQEAKEYFTLNKQLKINYKNYNQSKSSFTRHIKNVGGLNDFLYADMQLVLPNDMLTKVDLMSMANSLEVRVPFLDHEVVDFLFSLPSAYKIDAKRRKKILVDTYRNELPEEIFTRAKHGFEVPLLKWFKNELRSLIDDDLLSKAFINAQGIFEYTIIEKIKHQLYSNNPADAVAKTWALIVFQYWYKKHVA